MTVLNPIEGTDSATGGMLAEGKLAKGIPAEFNVPVGRETVGGLMVMAPEGIEMPAARVAPAEAPGTEMTVGGPSGTADVNPAAAARANSLSRIIVCIVMPDCRGYRDLCWVDG